MLDYREIKAAEALDRLVDILKPDLPEHLKRRDPKEPGRVIKELYEDRLEALVKRRFNKQKQQIKEYYAEMFPARKALADDALSVPEVEAKILRLIIQMGNHAMQLFLDNTTLGFDIGRYSIETINVARRYVAELVRNIDSTTQDAIRQAVASFTETPGMTIADLAEMLPFDDIRSRSIAVTETTNIYSGVESELGARLSEDYPDVRVVKTWYTNNDDIVRRCPICWPAHEQTVGINETFVNGLSKPSGHPNCRCWMSVRTMIE